MHIRPNPRLQRTNGYTLIELMLVIGILGLAGALLVPHLVAGDSLRVQAAVRKLIGDLSFAQSDALAHQGYRRVHFYADGRGYCLERVSEANYSLPFDAATADYLTDPLMPAGSLGWYIIDFTADERFDGMSISSVSLDGGGRDLVYDPMGGTIRAGDLPGTGGTIVLTAGDENYQITVSPFTGKLTVSEI